MPQFLCFTCSCVDEEEVEVEDPLVRDNSNFTIEDPGDVFMCPICFETIQEKGAGLPLVLGCGHTTCQGCVRELVRHGTGGVGTCPDCRAPLHETECRPNFALIRLARYLKAKTFVSLADVELSQLQLEEPAVRSKEQWTNDGDTSSCELCKKNWTLMRRRHHCRFCGIVVCAACSGNTLDSPDASGPQRACTTCYQSSAVRSQLKAARAEANI